MTGAGEIVGDALVKHPKTRFIAFTGSKEVGLLISEAAGKKVPGQIWIKRTVLEMGGKDATIVDEEADVDAAVEGVAQAAFGYQGQKCSACSRAIVSEKVYDSFVQKIVERAKKVTVGPSEDPENYMGPVVSKTALKTVLGYIDVGKKEGRVLVGGDRAPGDGYFVQATVIADVDPKARIAQEEIFGPVLAVIKARDFDHALEIANDTEFGLTGGVYSKNRGETGEGPRSVSCGESLFESEMHRRDGRRASVRRIQHVGDGFEDRWEGLFAAVPAGEEHRGESLSRVGNPMQVNRKHPDERCLPASFLLVRSITSLRLGTAPCATRRTSSRGRSGSSEISMQQRQRRVVAVGHDRADQKENRAGQGDAGRPRDSPTRDRDAAFAVLSGAGRRARRRRACSWRRRKTKAWR